MKRLKTGTKGNQKHQMYKTLLKKTKTEERPHISAQSLTVK